MRCTDNILFLDAPWKVPLQQVRLCEYLMVVMLSSTVCAFPADGLLEVS